MSINSALLAGVSGLSANSAALAAISQNIANVNTVGYKRTSAEFSTIVNGQNSGAGYSAGGVLANTRNFIAQAGQLQRTTSSTDLGIAGQGFFVTTEKAEGLDAGDARLFTRAGAFRVDDFGYLKNTAGLYLQGWPVDSEGGITTDPSDLGRLRSINVGSVGGTAEPTTRAQLNANLRSSQLPSQFVAPAIKNAVLDNTAPTPVSHNYTVDYARTGANSWDVTVREPSTNTTFTGNVTYDATSGALLTSTLPGASLTTLQIAAGPPVLTVPLASLGLNTSAEVLERYDVNTNSMSMYDIENDTGFKPDFQITVPVSDSKGGQRTIAYSFLKTENPNEWQAEVHVIPASDIDTGTGVQNGVLKSGLVLFTQDGRLDIDGMKAADIANPGSMLFADVSTASATLRSSDYVAPPAPPPPAVAPPPEPKWATALGIDDQSVAFDLIASAGGLTQYDSDSIVQAVVTNGTAFGNLSSIEIDEEGFVTAAFDNGVTRRIAQLALATFTSADSLTPAAGNAYRVSQGSGTYNLKTPGSGGAGLIGASQLEASTVDLSLEFTGLITTQRAYSASSKIITTADEMLAELISIKR